MKSCSDQKAYLVKVDRSTHITKGVISVFWFWGSKNCLPSPKGGRQMKSCSDGKTCLAKVDRSANKKLFWSKNLFCESCLKWPHYYREVISVFWFGGSKTRLPSPPRGKANKKLLWSKHLFSESCLKWPHYNREVISDFWLGRSKTRLPSSVGEGKQKVPRIKKLI